MRKAVIAPAALLVAAGLAVAWYLTRAPVEPLPSTDPATVAAIVVDNDEFPEVPAFAVDPADFARVLQLFEGGVRVQGPPPPWVVGERIVITYRDGRTAWVRLFHTGQGQGAYCVRHGYYRGSTDEEIAATLAACKQRASARPAD
jgi:hypothetical protein